MELGFEGSFVILLELLILVRMGRATELNHWPATSFPFFVPNLDIRSFLTFW